MIKIIEGGGDFNLEVETEEQLHTIVDACIKRGGYYTSGRKGKAVFIPWHRVTSVQEE